MSAEDVLLWGAVLCLGFIAGVAIYFELASFKRSRRSPTTHGFERRSRSHQLEDEI